MLIKRLTLKKILSFNEATVELGPLNVLIGPNAVGKSNLIEVIGLLQAAPNSLATAILRGGGECTSGCLSGTECPKVQQSTAS
jgi:predicted ATPase